MFQFRLFGPFTDFRLFVVGDVVVDVSMFVESSLFEFYFYDLPGFVFVYGVVVKVE